MEKDRAEAAESDKEKQQQEKCRRAGGQCDPPDPQEQVEMPLPDGVGGKEPTIFEILAAAKKYRERDNPHINPTNEDLGGGVVMVHLPIPCNIDPMLEHVPAWMDEEDLKALLRFLQTKYFDSLVNPVPFS